MGTYYRWRCDDLKEFFDPDCLLGPNVEAGVGYGIKAGSIPHSAWVIAVLQLDKWWGHSVRLICDATDEYDCDGFTEVSQFVLQHCLGYAPIDDLRFLRSEVDKSVKINKGDLNTSKEREGHIAFLRQWSENWPTQCRNDQCLNYGSRHNGECDIDLPNNSDGPKMREYFMGLGSKEADPREVVSLCVETTNDFRVKRLMFDEASSKVFVVKRVVIRGVEGEQEIPLADISIGMLLTGFLALSIDLKPCQIFEIYAENTSSDRATLRAALCGLCLDQTDRNKNVT